MSKVADKGKRVLTQKNRFTSFQNGYCPYCGIGGANLVELRTGGYHAKCMNPDCGAENHFSNRKIKDWVKE
jgi:hypothetical protein